MGFQLQLHILQGNHLIFFGLDLGQVVLVREHQIHVGSKMFPQFIKGFGEESQLLICMLLLEMNYS